MTDTLRDRIAAVLAGHHTDCDGSFLQCECDARWRSIHAWADHAADAVITELGLLVQVAGPDGIAHGQHRYISDWITNE